MLRPNDQAGEFKVKLNDFYKSIYQSTKAQLNKLFKYYDGDGQDRFKQELTELKERLNKLEQECKQDTNERRIYNLAISVKELYLNPRYEVLYNTMMREKVEKHNAEVKAKQEERFLKKLAYIMWMLRY